MKNAGNLLSWILLAAFAAVALQGCQRTHASQTFDHPHASLVITPPYQQIRIAGEKAANGIFDPSLAYGPDGVGWLTYSSVFGGRKPFGPNVETELARSDDHGKTWRKVMTINPAWDDSFTLPDGRKMTGNWNYEVSSLVYDPDDPGKEWKLFAHRLFAPSPPGFNDPRYSWIIFRYAHKPDGPWSKETALFGSGITPFPPFRDLPRIRINSLAPELGGTIAYSEPGALSVDDVLYLSLVAERRDGPGRVILLASKDHGMNWSYSGTLADRADAARLGFLDFDGSSLAKNRAGEVFLMVAPDRRIGPSEKRHFGTLVFWVKDLNSARLERDSHGVPVVNSYIQPDPRLWSGNGAGQSTFDPGNASGGIIFPQMDTADAPEIFKIFNTGVNLK